MYSISKPMNQSQAHNTTKLLNTDNKAQKFLLLQQQVIERAILKPFLQIKYNQGESETKQDWG